MRRSVQAHGRSQVPVDRELLRRRLLGLQGTAVPNPIRPRWGDYGAAAVDGNSIWIASEYIAHSCDYTAYGGPFFVGGSGDNLLGTCAGASHGPGGRTALANWSTRISKLTP